MADRTTDPRATRPPSRGGVVGCRGESSRPWRNVFLLSRGGWPCRRARRSTRFSTGTHRACAKPPAAGRGHAALCLRRPTSPGAATSTARSADRRRTRLALHPDGQGAGGHRRSPGLPGPFIASSRSAACRSRSLPTTGLRPLPARGLVATARHRDRADHPQQAAAPARGRQPSCPAGARRRVRPPAPARGARHADPGQPPCRLAAAFRLPARARLSVPRPRRGRAPRPRRLHRRSSADRRSARARSTPTSGSSASCTTISDTPTSRTANRKPSTTPARREGATQVIGTICNLCVRAAQKCRKPLKFG